MNEPTNNNDDQYKNPPIKRLPIKDPQIQPLGGSGLAPESRLPIRPTFIEKKPKPPVHKRFIENLGPILIISIFVVGIIYIWLVLTGYFDPLTMCRIRIHTDLVSGNKKTISQALKLLKKEDRTSYDMACKYVNRIYERTCIGADWHLDKGHRGSNEPGCYVKGSKSIYLKPDYYHQQDTTELRKDSIKKYSQLSWEYWNQ